MTKYLKNLWNAIPLEMRAIIFLVAFFGGLAAITSPAKAFDVTTCANGCKTVTGTLQEVLAYEGRAIVKPAHVAKPAHVVVKRKTHKPHKATNAVTVQPVSWVKISTLFFRFKGGKYYVKDVDGLVQPLTCSKVRRFTGTSDGDGWCFWCTAADGYQMTLVVGSSTGYGQNPTGWWQGFLK